ncbi:MAG: hypothetical protein AAF721_00700 [Myxococcota bacterium]
MPARWKSVVAAATVATFAWWSSLSLVFDALRADDSATADAMQTALTRRWRGDRIDIPTVERERNPEWDFMARTFLVLALANDAIADTTATDDNLEVVDRIIADTLAAERAHGQRHFLLSYADRRDFVDASGRSVFVDGEIALMLAARASVAPRKAELDALRQRAELITVQMRRGPLLSAESYPDEAWTFCNTTALVALHATDRLLGTDHRELIDGWLAVAKRELIDPQSGLLVSSFTHDGRILDGPEGSTLWMTAHNLLVLDPQFAREQYALAKEHLAAGFGGFAWANEWPDQSEFADRQALDVDSGAVVPLLGASPGSSGMMILGAAAFDDGPTRAALLRSVHLGAFPIRRGDGLEFAAAGVIGNAVVLYALRFGPLWARLTEERA